MIEKNLSTLTINKLTKEQFEQALAQHRIQPDQLYMVADDSSDEGQYLPLTGGVLTGNNGYTIGLYPSNEDGEVSEPSIEMNNKFGDSAYISPAAIDLTYGDNYTYMCAEEGNIGVENSSGSAKINPDSLQIKNSETDISISALEGEYGDITLQETVLDSSARLSSAGTLSLKCEDRSLYASAEESYITVTTGDKSVSLNPHCIYVNDAQLTFPTSSGTLALTSDLDDIQTQLDNKSTVAFTRSFTSGKAIGSFTIDGISKVLYIPEYITSGKKSGTTIGNHATAEGYNTTASGERSHAEGSSTTASGSYSHAEGCDTTASATYSHAEGDRTTASNTASHAEGTSTTASGSSSHAEGSGTTASGSKSHAEGYNTTASTFYSHAEGECTTVTEDATVTAKTTANVGAGYCGHAEGYGTVSYGTCSHAEGNGTIASGSSSHAEGYHTTASGSYSHAGGYYTIANAYQYVVGRNNANTTAPTSLTDTTESAGIFIVGIGTSDTARSNGFRVNPAGKVYGTGTFGTSGADYAEYFEWFDGNPNNEDRRGHFVTLDGDKIRYATANDDYILGVVSTDPSVAGDMYSEDWHNRYLKDIFGSNIVDVVEVEETTNEFGEIIPAHTERRWVLNPDYNPDLKYVSREERPEWAAIGIVGKLVVVDDGTCQVNGYCYPNTDGIATASQEKTNYRVMERLDDTHIRIFIK